MKKICILLAVVLCLSLAGCGADGGEQVTDVPESTGKQETTTDMSDVVRINVKTELLTDVEDFKTKISAYGDVSFTETDGLLNVQMNSATYSALVDGEHSKAVSAIEAKLDEEDTCITDIEYDVNFRTISVYVNDDFDEEKAFSYAINVAAPALAYQMFLPNGQHSNVQFISEKTQSVIITVPLPYNT